jgi:hypothetical protein
VLKIYVKNRENILRAIQAIYFEIIFLRQQIAIIQKSKIVNLFSVIYTGRLVMIIIKVVYLRMK